MLHDKEFELCIQEFGTCVQKLCRAILEVVLISILQVGKYEMTFCSRLSSRDLHGMCMRDNTLDHPVITPTNQCHSMKLLFRLKK